MLGLSMQLNYNFDDRLLRTSTRTKKTTAKCLWKIKINRKTNTPYVYVTLHLRFVRLEKNPKVNSQNLIPHNHCYICLILFVCSFNCSYFFCVVIPWYYSKSGWIDQAELNKRNLDTLSYGEYSIYCAEWSELFTQQCDIIHEVRVNPIILFFLAMCVCIENTGKEKASAHPHTIAVCI